MTRLHVRQGSAQQRAAARRSVGSGGGSSGSGIAHASERAARGALLVRGGGTRRATLRCAVRADGIAKRAPAARCMKAQVRESACAYAAPNAPLALKPVRHRGLQRNQQRAPRQRQRQLRGTRHLRRAAGGRVSLSRRRGTLAQRQAVRRTACRSLYSSPSVGVPLPVVSA